MSAIIKSTQRLFENTARARVQSTLLIMGREWVERHGYSWEMLCAGPSEWPWRQSTPTVNPGQEIRRAITELNSFSDRELHDLRIHRSGIENAVRHGRCEQGRYEHDSQLEPQKSVA